MPKEIEFRGNKVTVQYIGGMQLARISASLKQLMEITGIGGSSGLLMIQSGQYELLILKAFDAIMNHLGGGMTLTMPEQLFYGSMGLLIGQTAQDVATAPMDDLTALVVTAFEQEAETQAGKRLMAIFAKFEPRPTSDTESAKPPASPSATTSRKKTRLQTATGGQ